MRLMMSGLPPGAVPTIMRRDLSGQFCCARAGSAAPAAKEAARPIADRLLIFIAGIPLDDGSIATIRVPEGSRYEAAHPWQSVPPEQARQSPILRASSGRSGRFRQNALSTLNSLAKSKGLSVF